MKAAAYLVKDMARFFWKRRVWWLLPIILFLGIIAVLVIFGQSSVISPFVYSLF
ncbi:MAG: hypothetical protein JW772_02310 [Candidatus Diapherotrites archaeon]|nr:hypothetical protein [Candidatus Diapherotrites archaeon]